MTNNPTEQPNTSREAFERAAKVHMWEPGPFLRDCNDIDAERVYELFHVDDAWKMWQAAQADTLAKLDSPELVQVMAAVIGGTLYQEYGFITSASYDPLTKAALAAPLAGLAKGGEVE